MKKEKTSAILYYIAAVCMFIVSAINFLGNGDTTMGIVWLAIGSCNLCLGAARAENKDNENKDE